MGRLKRRNPYKKKQSSRADQMRFANAVKQKVLWEAENGQVPEGHCVIFLDGNKENMALENLRCISRGTLARMNQLGLFSKDPELTEVGIHLAELHTAKYPAEKKIKAKRKENNDCKR